MAAALTASERKVANAILADYPFSGLQPIQELASRTGVSPPSITRFVTKIGYGGFGDFQRHLIGELKERQSSPLDLQHTERTAPDFLADYAGRISTIMLQMADAVPREEFETVCRLVADPRRSIFLLGGRVSDSIAAFLAIHLRQIRAGIYHLPGNPELWPEHVLRMKKRDVLILLDFRRYQPSLAQLAGLVAAKRRPTIVLITDKWISPIARRSNHVIGLPIEIGTAWDTAACAIAFVEALIVRVAAADWMATRKRIEAWDAVRLTAPAAAGPDAIEDRG